MEEQIGISAKCQILPERESSGVSVTQFIVCEKDERFAVFLEFVTGSAVGMTQGNGGDEHIAQPIDGFETGFVVYNLCTNVTVIDRKIRSRHNPGKHFFYRGLGEGTSPDVHSDFRGIDGFEEGKSHDVIPVGVRQQKREIQTALRQQGVACLADSGACIDNQYVVVFCPDFKAGGIAAVALIQSARYRDGPSGTPTANDHC